MNGQEIEYAAGQHHECPNVRMGITLLQRLKRAVDAQSDGWAYWSAPSKACEKLIALLQSAGNLTYGTSGTISPRELAAAVKPIRSMVTRQKTLQAKYGNKFEFDVDKALLYSAEELLEAAPKCPHCGRELTR